MAINLGKNYALLSRTSINGAAVASTFIYTVPAGKTLIGIQVIARVTAAGASVPATAQVNSSSPGDLFTAVLMTNVLALGSRWTFTDTEKSVQVAGGGTVSFEITVAATGGAQTLEVDLLGLLL